MNERAAIARPARWIAVRGGLCAGVGNPMTCGSVPSRAANAAESDPRRGSWLRAIACGIGAIVCEVPFSALLQSLRTVLERYPVVELGVLFGSRAGLNPHADSDVDVAILPVPGKELSLTEELRIAQALSSATRCEVDVVRLDRANPLLRRAVARQGRPILERSRGAWARFAADALLEYLDLEPLLEPGRKRYVRRVAAGSR